ncbi:exonuclease domain-containing protein [Nocardiopsis flavescens]|uniref:3'-5' exonuclease n=1 Tax=Nocardiopsis flavescens TaxID=758803 RepID=UPI0036D827E9
MEPRAQRVHGITPADLAGAPTWPQVWPRLGEIAEGRLLVAYNADFDRRLIAQTCRPHGIHRPRWEWACAMAWRGAAARTSRPGPSAEPTGPWGTPRPPGTSCGRSPAPPTPRGCGLGSAGSRSAVPRPPTRH